MLTPKVSHTLKMLEKKLKTIVLQQEFLTFHVIISTLKWDSLEKKCDAATIFPKLARYFVKLPC